MKVARELEVRRRDEVDSPWARSAPPVDIDDAVPTSRQQLLLSIQRSAGNAAVLQLVRQGGPPLGTRSVQRREAPTAPPAAASPETPAPGGSPTGSGAAASRTHATNWFIDYDQMKRGGGKAGERGRNDVLWVQSLIVGQGAQIQEFTGFNAAASGPALVGRMQHPAGSGHVSGNIDYLSAADVKVGAALTGAAKNRGVAAHQKQVAEDAARGYVARQFHLQRGDEKELEQGAKEAADAALAKDAAAAAGESAEPAPVPKADVDIKVVGRRKGQPALPTVNYEIAADSDCYVYVVIPTKEYKATVSKTTTEGDQEFRRREGSTQEREKTGASVDVSKSGSTTTQQSADVRVKQTIERKKKYAASFVRNTHTAVKTSVERSLHQIITELIQSTESEASRTTKTTRTIPDTSVDVEGEGQLRQETPSIWDRAFDYVKDKLGNLVKDKVWSYADKLIGKRFPLYRLIPKSVKTWAKRKITDLVWKGGKWLWNKITGGEAEVQHTPEEQETVTDTKVDAERRKESSRAYSDAKEIASSASMSYAKSVSEEVRGLFEKELNLKIEVDVGAGRSTTTTQSGSVGVKGQSEREKELQSGEVREESSQKATTRTYTTDVVRIETGKPVIELAVKPR